MKDEKSPERAALDAIIDVSTSLQQKHTAMTHGSGISTRRFRSTSRYLAMAS